MEYSTAFLYYLFLVAFYRALNIFCQQFSNKYTYKGHYYKHKRNAGGIDKYFV